MHTFSTQDKELFRSKGISENTIQDQINNFIAGFPFAKLVRPATPGDGIEVLAESEVASLSTYYDTHSSKKKVVKFVPASGAASRMFKTLFNFLEQAENTPQKELINADKGFNSAWSFADRIGDFAFYDDLEAAMQENKLDLSACKNTGDFASIINYLINHVGLDYGKLPKGLLKFHSYPDGNRVSMEEHLVEAASYARSGEDKAYVHFTVSKEHLDKFKQKADEVISKYEKQFGIDYDISYSVQKPSTDTLAVDLNNEPFRENDNSILFRPGGHGALIENLGDIDADLVFIKNIDNVVPDRLKDETTLHKKAIGGLLLKLQDQVFNYLKLLQGHPLDNKLLTDIEHFAKEDLKIDIPASYNKSLDEGKKKMLFSLLNRPMRICGMVKNEGEPGGGPFWMENSDGKISLQVVESSQIDLNNPEQKNHVANATHFNPVDLVCATKDFNGKPFDLHDFIDHQTGFISEKSKDGRELKALELPGLWNGAMSDWITLFVEVPIITFNPVKTVNDLLRDQHQSK